MSLNATVGSPQAASPPPPPGGAVSNNNAEKFLNSYVTPPTNYHKCRVNKCRQIPGTNPPKYVCETPPATNCIPAGQPNEWVSLTAAKKAIAALRNQLREINQILGERTEALRAAQRDAAAGRGALNASRANMERAQAAAAAAAEEQATILAQIRNAKADVEAAAAAAVEAHRRALAEAEGKRERDLAEKDRAAAAAAAAAEAAAAAAREAAISATSEAAEANAQQRVRTAEAAAAERLAAAVTAHQAALNGATSNAAARLAEQVGRADAERASAAKALEELQGRLGVVTGEKAQQTAAFNQERRGLQEQQRAAAASDAKYKAAYIRLKKVFVDQLKRLVRQLEDQNKGRAIYHVTGELTGKIRAIQGQLNQIDTPGRSPNSLINAEGAELSGLVQEYYDAEDAAYAVLDSEEERVARAAQPAIGGRHKTRKSKVSKRKQTRRRRFQKRN